MTGRAAAVPPWALAVAAMLSVQLGSALSVGLVERVGPGGTAWLRLSIGALVFVALARPPLRSVRRRDLPALLGLGVATGSVTAETPSCGKTKATGAPLAASRIGR